MLRAEKPRNSNLIPRGARHCPVLQSVCVDPAARVKHPGPEHPPPPGAEVTNEWSCISSHPYAFMAVYRDKLIIPNSEEEEGKQLYKTFHTLRHKNNLELLFETFYAPINIVFIY